MAASHSLGTSKDSLAGVMLDGCTTGRARAPSWVRILPDRWRWRSRCAPGRPVSRIWIEPATAGGVDPAAWRGAFERLRATEADGRAVGEPSGPWLAAMDARWIAVERRLATMDGSDVGRARRAVGQGRSALRAGIAMLEEGEP